MTIDRICAQLLDARSLRLALLEQLRRAVPFDAYAWLLTDPVSAVGAAPLADVPVTSDLPRLIRLKYATQVNRWTHVEAPVVSLHTATGGRLESSLMWSDMLADLGVRDVASVVFRDRFGCWGFLDLWRNDATFTAADLAALTEVEPVITEAIRATVRQSFADPDGGDEASRSGPAALVLSPELEVKALTAEAEERLRVLVPPEPGRATVPAAAYNVGAQLLAVEAGIDQHLPTARVHLDGGSWLTFRAARIGDDIAVTIEATTPAERQDLFARSAGLSPREAELLQILAGGADTRAVARQMFVSEHTVQDHLKAIFAKTDTHSRRELLTLVSGR